MTVSIGANEWNVEDLEQAEWLVRFRNPDATFRELVEVDGGRYDLRFRMPAHRGRCDRAGFDIIAVIYDVPAGTPADYRKF